MPVPAVADEVDQHVAPELLPIGHREVDGGEAGLRIVRVHVDDRYVEALREIAGVPGRARVFHVGGEADLVVGDDV